MISSPIANRQHRDVEGLIGFFANTLALRNALAWIHSTCRCVSICAPYEESTFLGAYANQEVPFEQVVEAVRPAPKPKPQSSFSGKVMLSVQCRAPRGRSEWSGLQVEPVSMPRVTSQFDLSLWLTNSGEQGVRLPGLHKQPYTSRDGAAVCRSVDDASSRATG